MIPLNNIMIVETRSVIELVRILSYQQEEKRRQQKVNNENINQARTTTIAKHDLFLTLTG
jgi:hypothetical protein